MTHDPLSVSPFPGLALLAAIIFALCGSGCSTQPAPQELTLTSLQHNETFTQQFARAYTSRDSDGDTDLVLMDEAAEIALSGVHRGAPVRQVMHLRVLWNPKRDLKADQNSTSNATIHWYVMGNTPESASDIIEYAGTAYITLASSDGFTDLTIRNASVHPVAARGQLQDPVGSSMLRGAIHATENRDRLLAALTSVRTVVASAISLPTTPSANASPESPSSSVR